MVRLAALTLLAIATSQGLAAQDLVEELAPGVRHHRYDLAQPRNVVHVLEFDMADPRYGLELGFAGGDRAGMARRYERTSEIAPRYETPGRDVLAATNASYFEAVRGERVPIGPLASGGNLIGLHTARGAGWEVYMLQASGAGWIGSSTGTVSGAATFAGGESLPIPSLDRVRRSGALTLYTPDWGRSTGTRVEGVEVVVEGASGPLQPDQEVVGRIVRVTTGRASVDNPIPADGFVLSASGLAAAPLLRHAVVGSRVVGRFDLNPRDLSNADLLLGGAGWLVEDGLPATHRWTGWSFGRVRHPRTAIGWNGTRHWLVTVDGRRAGGSVGMTFQELAGFLVQLGARSAMNLDGGGSTTMWIDGQGVVNRPCDPAGERSVANSLLLVDRGPRVSPLPLRDPFAPDGRSLRWDDKFSASATVPFRPAGSSMAPAAPGLAPDGTSLRVRDASGGYETVSVGLPGDADYRVEALVHCDLRPEAARDGFERVGIFARDDGNANFDSDLRGGGNNYALVFEGTGRFRAMKVVRGRSVEFPVSIAPLASDAWVRLAIVCRARRITFEVDGRVVADVFDDAHARGRAGIGWHEFYRNDALARGAHVECFVMSPAR